MSIEYSPYKVKYSWPILQISLYSFNVFSVHAEKLLAYSETSKYFWRIQQEKNFRSSLSLSIVRRFN